MYCYNDKERQIETDCQGLIMYQVLLADDETIFLEFMKSIIPWEDYDCKVCVCLGDGKAVMDYIVTNAPDIAFVDISMPIMDGISVCRAVKESEIQTKLVICTAHDEFNFAYQAIKLGIDDYLLNLGYGFIAQHRFCNIVETIGAEECFVIAR